MKIEKIQPILDELKQIEVESLERKGTDFPFSDIQQYNVLIFEGIKILEENPEFLEQLPIEMEAPIENFFRNFLTNVHEIQGFNPSVGDYDPRQRRSEIMQSITHDYQEFYQHLLNLKIFSIKGESLHAEVEELVQQAQKGISEIQEQKEQVNETLEIVKKVSSVVGVSKFEEVFAKQARQNQMIAYVWLFFSVLVAGIIGLILWWIFDHLADVIQDGIDFQISLQIFLSKILFFSFASVVFYQVVKNYNANMHLYTLNKHRANSLASFQAFVKSTEDPKVRDAVLIQATRSIFEAGQTGYVSSPDVAMPNIETIKLSKD